jgi:putative membrane protein
VTLVGLQGNLMAALITLSPTPLYTSYAGPGGLADQQWAGLIMWIPAGVVYILAGLLLFAGWLRESERRAIVLQTVPVPEA